MDEDTKIERKVDPDWARISPIADKVLAEHNLPLLFSYRMAFILGFQEAEKTTEQLSQERNETLTLDELGAAYTLLESEYNQATEVLAEMNKLLAGKDQRIKELEAQLSSCREDYRYLMDERQ